MFFNTHVTDSKTSPLVQELLSCYSVETQQQLLAAFQTNIEGPPKLSGGSLETQGSFQTNIGGPPKLSGGSLETQGSFQTNIGGPSKISGGASKGPSKWVRLNIGGTFLNMDRICRGLRGLPNGSA